MFCQYLPSLLHEGGDGNWILSPTLKVDNLIILRCAPLFLFEKLNNLTIIKFPVTLKQFSRPYICRIFITDVDPLVYTLKLSFILNFLDVYALYKTFLKNRKRFGTSLPVSFSAWFLKKISSHAMFYWLTTFHCLTAFTFWDIRQYVYCNYMLSSLWSQKVWN